MRTPRPISAFLTDQTGAVSVDWVVFTAAVIGIGMVMLNAIGPSATTFSNSVSSKYATTRVTVVQ